MGRVGQNGGRRALPPGVRSTEAKATLRRKRHLPGAPGAARNHYNAAEVGWRLNRHHHAGLIICADSADRVETLVHEYSDRFFEEFCAIVPAPDKPTAYKAPEIR